MEEVPGYTQAEIMNKNLHSCPHENVTENKVVISGVFLFGYPHTYKSVGAKNKGGIFRGLAFHLSIKIFRRFSHCFE